ncbi:MAG: hypothetical protein HZA35_02245 [Parcubacteria group bacterium]|nr:hypothetical protein [Parcubacteria group bacterium]
MKMKAIFNPKKQRLWCHSPKPEYALDTDWADQWYIGARTLPLVRPQKDIIILPGGNNQTQQFAEFCTRILGLTANQVLWTTGKNYLMDDDIKEELFDHIQYVMNQNDWEIIPYSVTEPFLRWATLVNTPIFGDNEQWVRIHSNKSILHPNAITSARDPLLPLLMENVDDIRLPRGYACTTNDELNIAYDLLRANNVKNLILKPAVGTTGEGIIPIDSRLQIVEYSFPMGTVVLEERLQIDTDVHGKNISPSIQYVGKKILGNVTDQTFKGVAYEGNSMPSTTSPEFQRELLGMVRKILAWLKPYGPGGFDFLSVDGKPVLIDPNVGRFTGAHPAKIFQALYAPKMLFACWKIEPIKNLEVFWDELNTKNIAFIPSSNRSGVFPLCYLQGMWGMLIAFGLNQKELTQLRTQAEECL